MFVHDTQLRVRYAEVDQMGYVYYGNYAQYFEVARVEALRSLGASYRDLENAGILMPVSHYSIDYIRPAHYDDALTIRLEVPELPRSKIVFLYTTFRGDEILNKARTDLVFLSADSMRVRRAPPAITEHLAPFYTKGTSKN